MPAVLLPPWCKRKYAISQPTVIPRPEHNISRALISEAALRVLYRLLHSGYNAYLVGGGVRDLLLGREPKDFDIATNARPEQVRQIFRNCRLVGRRFLLAHVHFGQEIVEVATFRAAHDQAEEGEEGGVMEDGRILRDNVYGTLEQDAWRRDFTVNALYYNLRDFSVVDFGSGMEDLRAGVLRLVGEPYSRYREDPVRMLRAVRFAAKLGFRIAHDTETPLLTLGYLLREIPPARLFDEVLKLFLGGTGLQTFELLRHYDLFAELFPQTELALEQEEDHFPLTLLARALSNTDERIMAGKPVTPAFLFAALLWEPVRQEARRQSGMPMLETLHFAADCVLQEQVRRVAIPRRYTLQIREIWSLQGRFTHIRGRRHHHLLDHPRFRAAYDFLLLRLAGGEDVGDLVTYWTQLQEERGLTIDNSVLTLISDDGTEMEDATTTPDAVSPLDEPQPIEETPPAPTFETPHAEPERPRRRRYRSSRRKAKVAPV
ncbi:poly(A) polymerase I [Gammaproteobacteria bacterium]